MEFYERLKEQRLKYRFTQQQIADKIEVDVTTYAHYESGRRTPDIKRLRLLCSIFGIAFEENFPLVRTVEYPSEYIRKLADVNSKVVKEFNVLKQNNQGYSSFCILNETLKEAIKPVQDIWEKAMSSPEMDLTGMPSGQVIMRVNYRPQDWILLSESLKLQSEIVNYIIRTTCASNQ